MQKITPFLWFEDNLKEAVEYYTSIFKDSKIVNKEVYENGEPVITATFELLGQRFMALQGGKQPFTFNESVSFFVDCEDQAEVDYYWNALTANGGQESMCGWLKDKYGLSWQIIPKQLMRLMGDKDQQKAQRVMQAMLKMRKIIVADLEKAYNG